MTIPLDESVVDMLEDTEFSRHETDSLLTYHNKAEPSTQKAKLCLVSEYDTAEEAAVAELLTDFYLAAINKGSEKYPSSDALTRAYWSTRTNGPSLYTMRSRDRLTFTMDISIPPGDKGEATLEHVFSIVDDTLSSPLLLTEDDGERILEEAREQCINGIEDNIKNHSGRAHTLFKSRFFPEMEPLSMEAELEMIQTASLSKLTSAYEGLLSKSFPVLLFSGDSKLDEIQGQFINFAKEYEGTGEESVLQQPEILRMSTEQMPIAETGPSQQMQFIRAYPLIETPSTAEDKAALKVVNNILGGGWTGYLMQIIREEHHLVYGINSSYNRFTDSFTIRTEHDPSNYEKMSKLTQEIVEHVASGGFTDEEFVKMQEQMLEGMLVGGGRNLVSCDQPGFRIGEAYKQFIIQTVDQAPAERYKILAGLSPEDGRRAAQKYLNPAINQIFTYSSGGEDQ